MKRALPLLLAVLAALPLAGCGSSSDHYDPNKIIQKQEGSGPPPLNKPMSEADAANKTGN